MSRARSLARPTVITGAVICVVTLGASACSDSDSSTTGGATTAAGTSTTTATATASATGDGAGAHTSSNSPPPTTSTATSPSPSAGVRMNGNAGGYLMIEGRRVGRDDKAGTAYLRRTLGDAPKQNGLCKNATTSVYQWGAFSVTVMEKQPSGEYGFSYPAGAISGWAVDAKADGESPTVTGPGGIRLGATLAQLRAAFPKGGEWDFADLTDDGGKRQFEIFAGDTVNAQFILDSQDRVTRIESGWTCDS